MSRISIVTALPSESAPCLAHYRLKRITDTPLVLYSSEQCLLLQTGIGKLKAAANVGALLATRRDIDTVINLGICGAKAAIGTLLLASEVHDVASGRRWYPHMPPRRILPEVDHRALQCLDQPSDNYQEATMFDMESAGIVEAASARLDLSRVHCLKVVSDSPERDITTLSKPDVQDLIESALHRIDDLLHWCESSTVIGIEGLEVQHRQLLEGRHSTVTEAHTLKRLLERHVAITGGLPQATLFETDDRIRDVNATLTRRLESLPVTY